MAEVTDFPKQVIVALAQCIEYLSAFRVADALLATNLFAKFTTRAHMLLNGNTLTNLCVIASHCESSGAENTESERFIRTTQISRVKDL
jgi:DNA mismatch repair protein MSH3